MPEAMCATKNRRKTFRRSKGTGETCGYRIALCGGWMRSVNRKVEYLYMRMPQAQIELIEKVSAVKKCGGCPICRIFGGNALGRPGWLGDRARLSLGGQAGGASAMLDVLDRSDFVLAES